MNIERDYEPLDLKNVAVKDFKEETQYRKDKLSKLELDFSSISKLRGEKTLMELAFQHTKNQLV